MFAPGRTRISRAPTSAVAGMIVFATLPCLPGTARADDNTSWMAARSRLYFFLDPEARALDPHAPSALGVFTLGAGEGSFRAEASGWVGNGPVSTMEAGPDTPVSGDVRTLVVRYGTSRAWVAGGRQLTAIGTTDLDTLDGVSGGLRFGTFTADAVAARQGPDPRHAFGNGWVFGGDLNDQITDELRAGLGARHRRFDDTNPETQFTARFGYTPSAVWDLGARARAAVETPALVEVRADASYRPLDTLSFDAYAQRTDIRAFLPPDDILSVFAQDQRNQAGARTDYSLTSTVNTHLELLGTLATERAMAGGGNAGLDWHPRSGELLAAEGEQRYDPSATRSTLRTNGRVPFSANTAGTFELVGDRAQSATDAKWNGAARLGVSVTPFTEWSFFGAIEGGLGDAFPDGRLGGLLFVEYAAGAPVRWGGLP